MSLCYNLECDTCKSVFWCGQSNILYGGTMDWLKAHMGHDIRFLSDNCDLKDGYTNEDSKFYKGTQQGKNT